jgi:ribonuclease-3
MEFSENVENVQSCDIEEALGYSFRNPSLLVEAMTHSSYANEQHTALTDNERLEFLGDAVLDLAISQYLLMHFPDSTEGELTRIRAEVVAMPSLARLAERLDLGSGLLLGRGEERSGGRSKPNLLADTLEALFGAIFIDGGYEAARSVILPLFIPLLHQAAADAGQDFKSRLQEVLQAAQRGLPAYHLAETNGPAHNRIYHIDVLIDERLHGSGQGRTKKEAEQAAAKAALETLDNNS